jgi:hypothetical protein
MNGALAPEIYAFPFHDASPRLTENKEVNFKT